MTLWLFSHSAWCRLPGGKEAHLWQCAVLCAVLCRALWLWNRYKLLSLINVESEVVFLVPVCLGAYLFSVVCFILGDQIHHMSSAYLTITMELFMAIQSYVYKECRRGLTKQPCRVSVLRVSRKEMLLPILSTSPESNCTGSCSGQEWSSKLGGCSSQRTSRTCSSECLLCFHWYLERYFSICIQQ